MIYYVSNTGSGSNDGLSPDSPLQTIAEVNLYVKAGDSIKFKCGDSFYGSIDIDGDTDKVTEITSYGEGEKPIISQYKIINPDAPWCECGENIWKLDIADTSGYIGNIFDINTNIGFINVDGKIMARRRFYLSELQRQWDFYCDDRYIYVYSISSPSDISKDIKLAPDICNIVLKDGMKISNLNIVGSGGHGIRGSASNVSISNCELHELGGSKLMSPHSIENVRYGNGIEIWSNSENVEVKDNILYDIYDVALTMQGNEVELGWKNVRFTDNIIYNCEQSFEIWSKGDIPGTGHINCRFENNVCINAGGGWSHSERPDRDKAVHLLMYSLLCPLTDISLKNNVFYMAKSALYYKAGNTYHIPDDYVSDNNFIYLMPGQNINAADIYVPVEEHNLFSKYFNREQNSVFTVVQKWNENPDIIELYSINHK